MTTANEIIKGIPQACLNSTVNDVHLAELAKVMKEWQELAPFLDITPAEEEEIAEKYQGDLRLQKREALRKWREKTGSKATYRRLIVIFCTQGKVYLAEKLKDLLLVGEEVSGPSKSSGIIDNFRGYLIDCYSTAQHPSSFQWPFSSIINERYVELELFDVPAKGDAPHIASEYYGKPIVLQSIFTAGNSTARKVILIEGVAGVGKTALSWYACKEWAAGNLFSNIKLLIHVSLGDPAIRAATKVADLIPHPIKELRKKVVKATTNKRGEKDVCFWLEGFDEAPPSLLKVLFELVAGLGCRSIPNAHVILTSRPGYSFRLTSYLTGKVIIKGFLSLDSFFATCTLEDREQLVEALKMKPELHSLCHLPLNAIILVYLYEFLKDNLPTTHTGLFDPLLRNFLVRHIQTRTIHKVVSIENLPDDLPVDVHVSLNNVSKLAFDCVLQRKKVVNKKVLAEFGFKNLDNALGFLRNHQRLTRYGPAEDFSFVHLSIQEFLAAFHLSRLEKHSQIVAVKSLFEQNPLSPVLTFYAGLTGLGIKKCRETLFKVLAHPLDPGSIARQMGLDNPNMLFNATLACDPRRQLLGLLNCIYETQNPDLVTCMKLPTRDVGDLLTQQSYVHLVSDEGISRHRDEYIPFIGMLLYPTDCLAIGYFARHASNITKHRLYLQCSRCMIGDIEMKALTQELHKPALKGNVILSLGDVYLSTNALHSLDNVFNPCSCLYGLTISGNQLGDVILAAKIIINGYYHSRCEYLEFYHCCSKVVYHIILLLRSPQLKSLNLCHSYELFISSKMTSLFSEALKYTTISMLGLDNCRINDDLLMILAPAVCHKNCRVLVFDIDCNPYTDHGLTRFLKVMLRNEPMVNIAVLSVNHVSDVHTKLVEEINQIRIVFQLRPPLKIGCMSELSDKSESVQDQVMGLALLQLRPDLEKSRSPHH